MKVNFMARLLSIIIQDSHLLANQLTAKLLPITGCKYNEE